MMSNNKPQICILEIHKQYKVPQKEDEQNAVLHKLLTGRLSFREKPKTSPLIMARRKKNQDVWLGREEAEISLLCPILHQLEIYMESPISKR